MDKLIATAHVDAVFSTPVREGDLVIINCAEVLSALGFGVGSGEGGSDGPAGQRGSGSGGGGGGQTFSRPVAIIVATPSGVTVKPIVDTTKLAIAALTTLGFMAATLARLRRGR
jgi:uncharacterized spore protein YtfJ